MNKVLVFVTVFFFLQPLFCNAQKKQLCFAHYNSKTLLENWSDWQEKELKVEEYRDSLQSELKLNKDAFMKQLQEYQEKPPGLPIKIEQVNKKFQKLEKQLLAQEAAINSQVLMRKQELEKPLNERLDNALQIIAERKNYTYILDASTIKMHINGGEDITSFLREELEELEEK